MIFDQLAIEGSIEGLDTEFLSEFPVHTWQSDAVVPTDNVGFKRVKSRIVVRRIFHSRMIQAIPTGGAQGFNGSDKLRVGTDDYATS